MKPQKNEGKELDMYIKEHLKNYIQFQLKQGYEFKDIKKVLSKYGYSEARIGELAKGMGKVHHINAKRYKKEDLDKESYYYIGGVIADYIKKQLNHGYDLEHIKKALLNKGHDRKVIQHAITLIKGDVQFHMPSKVTLIISLLVVFAFIFALGVELDHASSIMLLAFAPATLAIIINYILISNKHTNKIKTLTPVLAIVLVIVLFIAIMQPLGSDIDHSTILILNVLLVVILTVFMLLFSKR